GKDSSAAADETVEWLEVEGLECAVRPRVPPVVRHQEPTVHEEEVGLHAPESAFEGVEQRPAVEVVVAGVGRVERWGGAGGVLGGPGAGTEPRAEQGEDKRPPHPRSGQCSSGRAGGGWSGPRRPVRTSAWMKF